MITLILQRRIQIVLVVILVVFAYSNIFANSYVAEDDEFIEKWEEKRSIGQVGKILAGARPETRAEDVYRPVRGVFYVFYWQIFGPSKFGYHLHSIVVHLVSTVFVYLIVEQLTRILTNSKRIFTNELSWLPFVTALLFGLHPIHTEAITFISSAMDMGLGPAFMFGAIYFWLKGPLQGKGLLISTSLAFLGYFTSDITLILPALLVLIDLLIGRLPSFRQSFVRYGPYIFGVIFFLVAKSIFLDTAIQQNILIGGSKFNLALLFMPIVIFKYIMLLIFPINLSISHLLIPKVDTFTYEFLPFIEFNPSSFWNFQFFVSLGVVLTLLIVAILFFKRERIIAFSIIWFFLGFLLVSNIFVQPTIMSERYIYISSFGFCMLAAYLLIRIYNLPLKIPLKIRGKRGKQFTIFNKKNYQFLAILVVGLVVSGYGFLTFRRNFEWKNELTLWSHVLRIYPDSPLANFNLSYFLANENRLDLAVGHAKKTTELLPNFHRAHMNLAIIQDRLGEKDEAAKTFEHVFALNPLQLEAYIYLANIHKEAGDLEEAQNVLESALEHEEEYMKYGADTLSTSAGTPQSVQTQQRRLTMSNIYKQLGSVHKDANNYEKASEYFKKSLLYNFQNKDARKELGNLVVFKNKDLLIDVEKQNIYFSKLGFSFFLPLGWKAEELADMVRLTFERTPYVIAIENDNKGEEEVEDYIDRQKDNYGILQKHGFIKLGGAGDVFARLWDDKGVAKSQFFVFEDRDVIKILVYPVTKDAQAVVEQLVASLEIN